MKMPAFALPAVAGLLLTAGPSGPVPPCGDVPIPAYGATDTEPAIRHWGPEDVSKDWRFPSCVPWEAERFASLVTIAGRFPHTGGADSLVARAASVSSLKGVRYWSQGKAQWQTFIEDAYALSRADKRARRADFSVGELIGGEPVFFLQKDNTAGEVVYRMRVHEASERRVVIGIDNAQTVRKFLMTVLHPGDAETLFFFDRESDDTWRSYFMMRISDDANDLVTRKPSSSVNRAVAVYRHFTGAQTDRDPPAAR